jgi:hypothetical protein
MKTINILTPVVVIVACCLLLGCASKTRSISQSGYHDHYQYAGPHSRELDEFDVLGLNRSQPVTEDEILRASSQAKPVRLAPGSTILLVQSGAMHPDGPMVAELRKHFTVVPFNGLADEPPLREARGHERTTRHAVVITDPDKPASVVPLTSLSRQSYRTEPPQGESGAYSRLLRLAAARAGASMVVCYWGILESGTEEIATKTVSWIPVMNWFVYDQRQHMRIRLKVAVIDVPTGNWSVFSAQPLEDKRWSVRTRREVKDQQQVESLKRKAYALAAHDLLARYAPNP